MTPTIHIHTPTSPNLLDPTLILDNLLACGRNLYADKEGGFRRCLDLDSGDKFLTSPQQLHLPEKVVAVYARKFSAVITKSYDCLVWGQFSDFFIERYLNPFEKYRRGEGESEDEEQDFDQNNRVSIANSKMGTGEPVKIRLIGLAERYACFVDTENYGYEWGLLSDVDHQENAGFVRSPRRIELLAQREFRNITAGPDFVLSDTVLRTGDLSGHDLAEDDKGTFYMGRK